MVYMNQFYISYTAEMSGKKRKSLKNLLFIHEIAFLVLVAVTGVLGGLSTFFWQETSSESVRINNLIYATEQIRSELFRQIQQVIRARLMEDPRANSLYRKNSRKISELFNELRRQSSSREEAELIQSMAQAYRIIQADMNAIFTDPYSNSPEVRMKIIDPRFSQVLTAGFENSYLRLKSNLSEKHEELQRTIEVWGRFAPVLIPIFFILGVILVLAARHFLVNRFVRPMATVKKGAMLLRAGDLEHRIPEEGVEEVSEISHSLNSMAAELSSSQKALVESERQAALGTLIPVVAHNIRNPLASIRASAQILEDLEDREELAETKLAIMNTIDRLERWVNALVSYLHPLQPQIRAVSVSHLIESSVSMLSSKIEEKNIHFEKIGWELDRELEMDPDLMEQALYCLLANAIEASPDQGKIELGMESGEQEFSIRVIDQGAGLPFEPRQGDLEPGPSTKKFGTGLGIPVAFKICQTHGWQLQFKSDEKGTEARIICPLKENELYKDE